MDPFFDAVGGCAWKAVDLGEPKSPCKTRIPMCSPDVPGLPRNADLERVAVTELDIYLYVIVRIFLKDLINTVFDTVINGGKSECVNPCTRRFLTQSWTLAVRLAMIASISGQQSDPRRPAGEATATQTSPTRARRWYACFHNGKTISPSSVNSGRFRNLPTIF